MVDDWSYAKFTVNALEKDIANMDINVVTNRIFFTVDTSFLFGLVLNKIRSFLDMIFALSIGTTLVIVNKNFYVFTGIRFVEFLRDSASFGIYLRY